jgi:hypothetical protein
MVRSFSLILIFCLPAFGQNLLASGDTAYAAIILGSLEFEEEHLFTPKYCRPQAGLIAELKSAALAEEALRQAYQDPAIQKSETAIKSESKWCMSAFDVIRIDGDTAWLRFINTRYEPGFGITYLNRLMDVYENRYVSYLTDQQARVDSLYEKIDAAALELDHVRMTLYALAGSPPFTVKAHDLVLSIEDSVSVLKKNAAVLSEDQAHRDQRFTAFDELLMRLKTAYADTAGENFRTYGAGYNQMVFQLEFLLAQAGSGINLVHHYWQRLASGSWAEKERILFEKVAALVLENLGERLSRESLEAIYRIHSIPPGVVEIGFEEALHDYRQQRNNFLQLVKMREQLLIEKAGIVSRSKIVATATDRRLVE